VKGTTPIELWELVQELAATSPPDPTDLATNVRVKIRDKYDRYLGDDLLNLAYASRAFDVPAAWRVLGELANLSPPNM
jgi:ATP-dependent helicase Lhr and Lhr-like helicase